MSHREKSQDRRATDELVRRIKAALERRSGLKWSVTQKTRGSDYGWLRITAPPRRRIEGCLSPEDHQRLSALLGKEVGPQGASVPSADDSYQEYLDRAEGREPSVLGVPYWD